MCVQKNKNGQNETVFKLLQTVAMITSLEFSPESPWKVPSLIIHLSSTLLSLLHAIHNISDRCKNSKIWRKLGKSGTNLCFGTAGCYDHYRLLFFSFRCHWAKSNTFFLGIFFCVWIVCILSIFQNADLQHEWQYLIFLYGFQSFKSKVLKRYFVWGCLDLW